MSLCTVHTERLEDRCLLLGGEGFPRDQAWEGRWELMVEMTEWQE